ncbi:target of EGR1 protein 1 [Poecilia latipinna]|uniref:Target of EGR1 protein 1 n=1 Tax=Poecilia latipinna TaxID=48699 RepID=A0A3B3UP85_9TELE|nr:PREDICTED: target of EGR1 protein 1 [Poecilia latipinna]
MSSSIVVPVIDVHSNNFKELWPAMVVAIKTSSFIALDTELSGLGNRKSLLAESIEDRYKAICHAARSRSILSLGIACYKKLDQKPPDSYLVQVYNLTLLCSEEYIIEPQSVQFLVQHGFDFNKQYGCGIPYCKGNNKGGSDERGVHIRTLFTELLRARKALVLHNGLIDMAFLYQSFYAHLPERLTTFTADLSEMFPAGIYDTKYVTEFELRLTASYLEYAYKKCKLENSRSVTSGSAGPHVHLEFCQYAGDLSTYIDYRECPAVTSTEGQTDVCQRFSAFGWCPNGTNCPLSHDTDLIILQDEKCKNDKRKRRKRLRDKKGASDTGKDCSVSDGAPTNKMANMEEDKEEAAGDQKEGDEKSCTDGNSHMDDGRDMKNDDEEENGVGEDKTNPGDSAVSVGEGTGIRSTESNAEARKKADAGTHRAGFDAYMTGYIFAYACALIKKEAEPGPEGADAQSEESWLPVCINKIYLSGKAAPLNVVKSTFAKSSKAHVQKMEMVWGQKM